MKANYKLIGSYKDCTLLLYHITIITSLDVPAEMQCAVGKSQKALEAGEAGFYFRCRTSDDSSDLPKAHFLTFTVGITAPACRIVVE